MLSLINRIFSNEHSTLYYGKHEQSKKRSPSNVRFDIDNHFARANLLKRVNRIIRTLLPEINMLWVELRLVCPF